jgi:hypothetical protein
MILRILALVLLVLLVARLLVRLALRSTGARQRSAATASAPGRPVKQLAPCPVCGTYFEAERGLPRRAGEAPVCSEACRVAAPGAGTGTSRSGSA